MVESRIMSIVKSLVSTVAHLFEKRPPQRQGVKTICPVCGYLTLVRYIATAPAYDICPICFWEDELWPDEVSNLDAGGGPNRVCLGEARENYRNFGAAEPGLKPYVRLPTLDDAQR